ncbi:unnamed protein product [Fructobacillus cardui]|nr:unnamed protein product [Fructobacillus cardui]
METKRKMEISKNIVSRYFTDSNILKSISIKTTISMYALYSIINYNYSSINENTFKKLSLYLDELND